MCIRDRNIRRAFRHLSGAPWQAPRWRLGPEPPQLWQVLGEAADALWAMIRELDEGGIACRPATLFADQSK
eukprot:13213455-Alexandrium_andersonii.AAC.1